MTNAYLKHAVIGLISACALAACAEGGGNSSESNNGSQQSSAECSALADEQTATLQDDQSLFLLTYEYPSNWQTYNYGGTQISAGVSMRVEGSELSGYGLTVSQTVFEQSQMDQLQGDRYEAYSRNLNVGGESYPVWVSSESSWEDEGLETSFDVEIPTENAQGEPYYIRLSATIASMGGGTPQAPPIMCNPEASQVLEEVFFSEQLNPNYTVDL